MRQGATLWPGFIGFTGFRGFIGWRLTGLRPEGCGRLSAAGCVRFAQGAEEKVLKIDRPFRAGGFLSLTALWAEGCGGGFAADF